MQGKAKDHDRADPGKPLPRPVAIDIDYQNNATGELVKTTTRPVLYSTPYALPTMFDYTLSSSIDTLAHAQNYSFVSISYFVFISLISGPPLPSKLQRTKRSPNSSQSRRYGFPCQQRRSGTRSWRRPLHHLHPLLLHCCLPRCRSRLLEGHAWQKAGFR